MSEIPTPDPVTGPRSRGRVAGLKGRAEVLRQRAAVLKDEAEAARGTHGSVDVAFSAYKRDRTTAGSLMAGALSFRLFLVLLPMVLVAVGGLGIGAGSLSDPEELARKTGLTAYAADVVRKASEASNTSHIVALAVGLVGMFFASRALVKALRVVHALAWRLPPPRTGTSLTSGLACMVAVTGVALSTSLIAAVRSSSLGLVSTILVSGVFYVTLYAGLQLALPRADGVAFRDLLPGSLLVAVGALAMNVFSSVYLVGKASHFSDLYGGLGVASVLLLWLYIVARLWVGAVVLNATLWDRKHPVGGSPI
jgi:uncharacterized BrkB/YihY/UPF0761 family membrane protein